MTYKSNSPNRHGALAAALLVVLAPAIARAAPDTIIYSFAGGNDGASPRSTLITDSAGNFYGTTNKGGPSNAGTVFKITPGGVETVLYAFTGGSDGGNPSGGPLVMDSLGNLYGTAAVGGARTVGTVFMVPPGGGESVVYTFTYGADGGYPAGGLVADAQGNLYGVCFDAGNAGGWGTVFKVTTGGALTTLHAFSGYPNDGGRPESTLAIDGTGAVYGTTYQGGPMNAGTVFKIPAGGALSTLYSFTNGSDGSAPQGGVVLDPSGNIYGTAGGGANNYGTFWEISNTGSFGLLYSFAGAHKGQAMLSNPILDAEGNFYGATYSAGRFSDGSVIEISPPAVAHHSTTWRVTSLHGFRNTPDGENAVGSPLMDSSGNLYGVTQFGGASGNGALYKIVP